MATTTGNTGLKEGEFRLVPYSTRWAQRFDQERAFLSRKLGLAPNNIEHIGSTAIPGLVAKPILDVAVRLPSLRSLPRFRTMLEELGYTYKGEFGLRGRHFFTKGNPVTVHLHLVSQRSVHWLRWLRFRDALLANPALARRYGRLKEQLARRYANNRPAYTQAKSEFIQQVLNQYQPSAVSHRKLRKGSNPGTCHLQRSPHPARRPRGHQKS